ncbi:low affinity iron permease family protein [Brucella pseudogrignonensis]|uniref:low affinity iron permease family protein n=1 Tax=Brucella pseudogrignonensis TaxID=419475 RepID=UPI00190AE333|nr:low affinity iron permease family protein [Brucella pseudogrignonensis]MBK0021171.1 low affinity iron permease family protein [Ochrobactrum sp. S45]MBK0042091.1 low affinity iron permease family protein [Ochrobactrum sp. S46]UKK93322.1 low affinity iron permease family protein [Brucella pseudogrignonensis]
MSQFFTQVSEKAAELAGHYAAFILATMFIVVWGISGPFFDFSDTWQLVINTSTTIITFLMVFLIQNSQDREASATQAKLDEILNLVSKTRSETIGAEHLPLDKLKLILKHLEQEGEKRATASAVQEENE